MTLISSESYSCKVFSVSNIAVELRCVSKYRPCQNACISVFSKNNFLSQNCGIKFTKFHGNRLFYLARHEFNVSTDDLRQDIIANPTIEHTLLLQ